MVCNASKTDTAKVWTAAKQNGVLTLAFSKQAVLDGAAVGVFEEKGKLKLVVNLKTAVATGAKFSTELLSVVDTVE